MTTSLSSPFIRGPISGPWHLEYPKPEERHVKAEDPEGHFNEHGEICGRVDIRPSEGGEDVEPGV